MSNCYGSTQLRDGTHPRQRCQQNFSEGWLLTSGRPF
jgi:hypothetical protein